MKYKVGDLVIRTRYGEGCVGEIVEVRSNCYMVKSLSLPFTYDPLYTTLTVGVNSQWTSDNFRKCNKLEKYLYGIDTTQQDVVE
jgi:hypothetical protein